MSYEGTTCPCGGKKQPNTMLCTGCESAFADHPSMAAYKKTGNGFDTRRHAAMTLLNLAHARRKTPPLR